MKNRLLLPLLLAALAAGCVADDSPLLLGNFHPFDSNECAPNSALASGGGSLDVAATTFYIRPVDVVSQTATVVQPGGDPNTDINSTGPNQIIIDRIWLDYTSNPELGLADENYPIYFVIQPASDESWMILEFFPGQADDTLQASVTPGMEVSVVVGVRATGNTRGGTPVQSNRAEFPITVYNSGWPGCGVGQVQATNGPCNSVGGQDGFVPYCCPADNSECTPGSADGGV